MDKELEVSNILIVESKNDKEFIQALITYLNCNIEVNPPINIREDDYEPLGGSDSKKLKKALKDLEAQVQKKDIKKVGIIIDIDDKTTQERLEFIETCINEAFNKTCTLSSTGEFVTIRLSSGEDIQLSCYLTNVYGQGELETLLKSIKKEDSPHADCLEAWKSCIESNDKKIKNKDFDKFWVDMYIRFDTCSKEEKKQAERKCSMKNFNYIMENKKDIWDFEHPLLNDLKTFLRLFCD
ncbi:MAG TPA: DUF3226 domain-containing protein [Kamptonema sp.]|nr:DUF3226 domain-containing protein [Kamptonema sp.]